MKDKMEKYANLLLKKCLDIQKNQALLINFPMERYDFVRIVVRRAYELGVKDIHFEISDPIIKHDQLKALDVKELKESPFWNKKAFNEYAKKHAAFLSLTSESPGLMKDVNPALLSEMGMYALKTSAHFDKLRDKTELAWCIAAVPTELWAKAVFPESDDPVSDLWETIFDVCLIHEEDPIAAWDGKVRLVSKRKEKLTKLHLKSLHYKNSLGTDLTIELPENHVWSESKTKLYDGRSIICNLPSEEIFTAPKKNGVNGIVYNSKPLIHNGVIIDKFWVKFKKGKAIEIHAEEGEDVLKETIASDKNGNRLGEVALVEFDSPINNTGLTFYETLFDENASCHLAFGNGFTECIKDYDKKSKKELLKEGLNQASLHVDFMIGTEDLSIVGTTYDGKEVPIFENGNFVI